jgi:hypothetical protein
MGESKRNDKRTSHQGAPRPPGYYYPSEIEQRNLKVVARLDRAAAALNMTRAAFLRRYGTASRPAARPGRNGKATPLDRS